MRKLFVVELLALCTSLNWAETVSPQVKPFIKVNAPVVALTHVRVIDGTGALAAEDQTVVIDHGRIGAVGPAARVQVPRGAQVMDLSGKTVVPGFFGMHDHTFYPAGGAGQQRNHHLYSAPRLYLAAGVTSIRTAGTYEPYNDLNLMEDVAKGRVPGPRINATGAYVDEVRGRVNGAENARRLVDYWADEGAKGFKAYTNVTRDELKAAIDEAHKRGLKITGHLCSVTFREAAAMGIETWNTAIRWPPTGPGTRCPTSARGARTRPTTRPWTSRASRCRP